MERTDKWALTIIQIFLLFGFLIYLIEKHLYDGAVGYSMFGIPAIIIISCIMWSE